MRYMFALFSLILIALSVAESQAQLANGNIAEEFIFDKERAFTYLQFDHIGKGPRRNENEPAYRIWLRFVNNCRVPIVIRTSGVPDGSPVGEAGLFHKVVANPPYKGASGGSILSSGASPKPAESSAASPPMPDGYDADVSSTAILQASESLLFSIPINHLSGKWHIEIPFRFDLPHKRPLHYEANIGGEPHMAISYWLSDLPADARKQVEAGVK
ncbi:MAG: hypothetical protein WCF68_18810 [Terriglobales bacterium]